MQQKPTPPQFVKRIADELISVLNSDLLWTIFNLQEVHHVESTSRHRHRPVE
jgi:hypothetical protein